LERQPPDEQIPWWASRLLRDRRYADYMAERLARALVGTDEGPFLVFRRRRFVNWLSDELFANRPYDDLVQKLITSSGLWTDSPAVNFITATMTEDGEPDEIRLAGRTTRAFLGVRLDCMQCHDDNLGGQWAQTDFHELAAFFSEAQMTALGLRDHPRAYDYKYLDAEAETTVTPDVPSDEALLKRPGKRRQRLAQWVTDSRNKVFSRATVNRAWALLFGLPLVDPVDNLSLEGPYPPGLETLAEDFETHGYVLHRLWKVMALARPFQLDSRLPGGVSAAHDQNWASFPLTRLRPEQVAGALLQSARLTTINADAHILVRLARFEQQGNFFNARGTLARTNSRNNRARFRNGW